jgi:Kef-type K+ transport system membrane component KefB
VELLGFAIALTTAAIIDKQVCSLAVGLGMIPRREVGLIFAGIGASLTLPGARGGSEPIISAATFGVVVIMVIVMTLLTPPILKWALGKKSDRARSTAV